MRRKIKSLKKSEGHFFLSLCLGLPEVRGEENDLNKRVRMGLKVRVDGLSIGSRKVEGNVKGNT